MKLLFILATGSLLTSCATYIPYTNEEYCAVDNMKFANLEKHDYAEIVHSTNDRVPFVRQDNVVVTNCATPKTAQEKEHVQYLHDELVPKVRYNQTWFKSQSDYDHALAASNEIQMSHQKQIQATIPKD